MLTLGGDYGMVSGPIGGVLFPGSLPSSRSVIIHLCSLPVGRHMNMAGGPPKPSI